MRLLCAVVLGFEAVVIGLAIPVAVRLAGISPLQAAVVWGGLALLALVLAALQRFGWARVAGSALQLGLIASGLIVPAMGGLAVLGVVFGVLWAAALILGSRVPARVPHPPDSAAPGPADR